MAPVPEGKQKIYGRIVGAMVNRGHTQEDAKKVADKAVKHRGVNDKGLTPGAKSRETPTSVAKQVANDRRLTPSTAGNIKTKDSGPTDAQKQSPSPYGSNTYGGGHGTDAKTAPSSLTQQREPPSSAVKPGPGPGKTGEYWCTEPTTDKDNL